MFPIAPAPAKPDIHHHEASKRTSGSESGITKHHELRSCLACHTRKVRCDKKNPCGVCVKRGTECVFPSGKKPRKRRKDANAELSARINNLEDLISSLGVQHDEVHEGESDESEPDKAASTVDGDASHVEESPKEITKFKTDRHDSIEEGFGRLSIRDGKSRYVSNQLWARMGEEVAEMRSFLDAPSSDEEEDPDNTPSPLHQGSDQSMAFQATVDQGFLFGHTQPALDLAGAGPSTSQACILWDTYKQNVDPLVKVVHRPSIERIFLKASGMPNNVSKAEAALLYSIYLTALITLEPVQCEALFGTSKSFMTSHYRALTEKAMAKASFLTSSSLLVLQAFVMYLVCLRQQDDMKLACTLTGLATNIARGMGLHRDGTHFAIGPFETEMRRRVWWNLLVLETRSSEDSGIESSFTDQNFDTSLPLNLNDSDIFPDMTEQPKVRQGCAEMTVSLLRFEMVAALRRLDAFGSGEDSGRSPREVIEEKDRIIEECHQKLECTYLQHMDPKLPINWVSATIARVVLGKLWIKVHHPFSMPKDQAEIASDSRRKLFIASIESLESLHLLTHSEHAAKWIWIYRSYMQWQAMIFVLLELCNFPSAADAKRAWAAIDNAYADQNCEASKNHTKDQSMMWAAMDRLLKRALATRQEPQQPSISNSMNATDPELSVSMMGTQPPDPTATQSEFLDINTSMAQPYSLGLETMKGDTGVGNFPFNQYFTPEWSSNGDVWANERNFSNDLQALNWAGWETGPKDFSMEDASLSQPGFW